jgi:predicted metal-dependent peptidase
MNKTTKDELLGSVQDAFRRVALAFPYLTGLIRTIQLHWTERVPTMGIFASGRLVMNPTFVESLSPQELVFVLAHELFHLTLRTHQRGEGTDPHDFNCAHDYIINDMLRSELQMPIPASGLDWPGARNLSAEKLMGEMQRSGSRPSQCWAGPGGGLGGLSDNGETGDVLDNSMEREWYPQAADQRERIRKVAEEADRAAGMQALMEAMKGKGTEAGQHEDSVAALRGLYRPPWELALQRWLDAVAPGERSYARPSRRSGDRSDIVLPGRKREGWTLHIILDTSGSMAEEVPRALGAIADFSEAAGVDRIHLIQCDTEVGRDEVLSPAEVSRWQVSGFGGSDLTPAMLRLGEDPEAQVAIVLTDGDIDYPEQPVPYSVLWVLPQWKKPEEFVPRYGRVVALN